MKSEWVAITGATGFIGRSICGLLHDEGWKLRALVRSEARVALLKGNVEQCVFGDLDNRESLQKLIADAVAVIHCAGAVRGASRRAFDRVNVDGLGNLLDAILASDRIPRLFFLSSLAAREPELSFYAASKRKAEQLLEQKAKALNWIALRPPAVYGPGDRELLPLFRLMAKGIAPVLGDRRSRFSMIYSEDIAGLVHTWLLRDSCPTGIYSLHDGKSGGYSWSDMAATVSRLCRRPVREFLVPSAMLAIPAWINRTLSPWLSHAPMLTPEKLRELRHPDWVCDNNAIQQVLDWQPQVQLEEGLKRTPGWCRSLS